MNLKTFVKVGNITNLSDARYCAGFGVDMLGFCLDPSSENYISMESAGEIMGWIAGPVFVAEFGMTTAKTIIEHHSKSDIPYYQVDNISTADELSSMGKSIILKLNLESEVQLNETIAKLDDISSSVKYILLDCQKPGLFGLINDAIKDLSIDIPIIQSFGVEQDQLQSILDNNHINGIELKGSREEKAGFKEYDELADILEELEIDD